MVVVVGGDIVVGEVMLKVKIDNGGAGFGESV